MDTTGIAGLLGADPIPWLLSADEPYARWATLTELLGKPNSDAAVTEARADTLADAGVQLLVDELPLWDSCEIPGHHSPKYAPNRLNLLADMGVCRGDFPRIDEMLDQMLAHQDEKGRFQSFGSYAGRPKPEWGSMLCDNNAITDVLFRYGLGEDSRVQDALARMREDLASTPQGRSWQCIPEKRSRWRGPGRKNDVCPQVTLEGLRALAHEHGADTPDWLLEVARTPLEVWRRRTEERPYQFGHGYQFKSVKWPNFWYDVLWFVETIGRYPALWRGPAARDQDRQAIAELAACLIEYNFDGAGRVTPRRTYRGFERFSFGQKREPSPFATARALVALAHVSDLAEEIAAVDVTGLPSSLGGSGTPLPPKSGRRGPGTCPVPASTRRYPDAAALPRVLARHHIDTPWVPASLETVVADVVGLQATNPWGPYVSLFARLPGFARGRLDTALYERRSLVKFRCMRGIAYVVRREMLPVVYGATNRPVERHAKLYAQFRGLTGTEYERVAPSILEVLGDGPLTTQQIRDRLHPGIDVAATVNLMTAQGLVLRHRPVGGWQDHKLTYVRFDHALPDIKLGRLSEIDATVALVRAYIRAFGPVTAGDVIWWTGIGKRAVDPALEVLGDEIVEIFLGQTQEPYLVHAADLDELETVRPGASPSVDLLPSLDPLVMGYARKERYLADEDRPYVFDRSGNATSVILVGGRISGVWDASVSGAPRMYVHLFRDEPMDVRELVLKRAEELGRFWHDEEARVETVKRMTPMAGRPFGAVVKPLR
ncbi:MAG: winged helix DNA-binding domain-containing protein [Actinomycetota bacterium]|nr:winged helix DNA-binding domain-containing protein [Actinomycetota bacterium]